MDLVVQFIEPYTFDLILPSYWLHSSLSRQFFEMLVILTLGGEFLYFFGSGMDYLFVFDRSWMRHKKILSNQIGREIWSASSSAPFIAMLTVPFLLGEWRGYSKMYYWPSEGGYLPGIPGMIISGIIFLIWTDCFVYWIHRFLHTFPWLYQNVHKEHHVWKIPTPWASCAFHPLDGWAQSVPYLVFPYLFPVQKHQYMIMYAFVKMWSVSIHDRFNVADNWLVNGASHHDIHHRRFDYNYGQYFTFWDRIGKSHYDTDIHGGDPDALSPAQHDAKSETAAQKLRSTPKSSKASSKSPRNSSSPKKKRLSAK